MSQLTLIPLGPIDAAAQPFLPEDAPPPIDPATLLSDLIDLRGGVALAEALATLDAIEAPAEPLPPAPVRARLEAAVRDIEGRMADAFEHAFKPRYRLPTAQRAQQVLAQSGVLENPKGAPLRAATRTLWAPFAEYLDTHLKRARFALRDTRAELAEQLPRISADAARLERLDAALAGAAHQGVEALVLRALSACEQGFGAALKGALKALPAGAAPDVSAWFAADGWVPLHLRRCQALIRAVVLHERRMLEALVEAACGEGE
ncbi:MAG: hypothetical protein H6704_11310 [Myxococcales bacterium]|nr:hypothetical protein [Myxococcales bacterium]